MEENGLFVLRERQVDKDGSYRVRHFQNSKGPAEQGERCSFGTCTTENIIVGSGFILARRATHGSEGDWKPVIDMLAVAHQA